jgi:hypothetical protein
VLGLDGLILARRSLSFVVRTLQALLPLGVMACTLAFEILGDLETKGRGKK